jgi:hypothetical protein
MQKFKNKLDQRVIEIKALRTKLKKYELSYDRLKLESYLDRLIRLKPEPEILHKYLDEIDKELEKLSDDEINEELERLKELDDEIKERKKNLLLIKDHYKGIEIIVSFTSSDDALWDVEAKILDADVDEGFYLLEIKNLRYEIPDITGNKSTNYIIEWVELEMVTFWAPKDKPFSEQIALLTNSSQHQILTELKKLNQNIEHFITIQDKQKTIELEDELPNSIFFQQLQKKGTIS